MKTRIFEYTTLDSSVVEYFCISTWNILDVREIFEKEVLAPGSVNVIFKTGVSANNINDSW